MMQSNKQNNKLNILLRLFSGVRFGLWFKMAGSFAIVIIIGGFVLAFSLRSMIENHFQELIHENDQLAAEEISSILASYYDTYGSWHEVSEALQFLTPSRPSMSHRGQFRSAGPPHMMITGPDVLITDRHSKVVYYSRKKDAGLGEITSLMEKNIFQTKGAEIHTEAGLVGYVYAGSMIDPAFGPLQMRILTSLNRGVFFSILIMIGIAAIIVILLLFHITAPIGQLNRAAQKVALGDLSVRVNISRSDELGKLGANFNTMTASLQMSEKWKEQVVIDVAHELRTPVALLHTRLEMLLDSVYSADKKQLELLYGQTNILKQLLSDLQELSIADAGTMKLNQEEIILNNLILQVIDTVRLDEKCNGNCIYFKPLSPEVKVYADQMKVGQVISNLLTNALRYISEQGRISVVLEQRDEQVKNMKNTYVQIAVEDTGPGIPLQEREKIFHRFYRIDSARSRAQGGTGLGLAISNEIVKAHGGFMKAESPQELTGARIVFTLPLYESPEKRM